jgi:SAM-dependent methyltransferase
MEIRVDFEAQGEWSAWHDEHVKQFPIWKEYIADFVRSHGYTEPLTGNRVGPADVRIDPNNYRESLAHGELNSRKRALLLEFDLLTQSDPLCSSRTLRIFAPEAQSRTAMILRGLYPYFLGTEYVPDERKRLQYYPIQHADLLSLEMPNTIYDVVLVSEDAMERVSTLSRAIQEIARVLRPDGVLIATCRFSAQNAGSSLYVKPSPMNLQSQTASPSAANETDIPKEEVFLVPGWDILEMCRQAGLHDARMVLHASSTYGITADTTPGVFVLSAVKGSSNVRPKRVLLWESKRINRVVGLLGIPRSGTTMFTAVLDGHRDIVSIYEPWNARKSSSATAQDIITAGSLIAEAERQDAKATTLLIKETALDPAYAENLIGVMHQAIPPLTQHLILLLRNPFHCFLSEVEGRRKWWGEAELEVSETVFEDWALRSLASFSQMTRLGEHHGATFVFYEACVSEPVTTFTRVMQILGLDFDEQQLRITQTTDTSKIRGDISLVEDTRDVANKSVHKRDQELRLIEERFAGSPSFERIKRVAKCFASFQSNGVITTDQVDYPVFLTKLREEVDNLH